MVSMHHLAGAIALTLLITSAELRAQEAPAAATGISGSWIWEVAGWGGNSTEVILEIQQEGSVVTGTLKAMGPASPIEEGKFENGKLTFKVTREMRGRMVTTAYSAELVGDQLKGQSSTTTVSEFEGKRLPPTP